jgi:nucleoside-diphosphate-sugar epimerase
MGGEPSRDLRDPVALADALQGCEGIYHMAAVSRVAWGEEDPATCDAVNVAATRSLIDLMMQGAKPWLVFASSREVYGNPVSVRVRESDPLAPVNVYGRSKAQAEAIIEAARPAGLRTAILRLSNVYGTLYDHPDRAVPALLWRALNGQPIELTGGDNYFDFVHVRDSVAGLVTAGDMLAAGAEPVPAVHLATGVATSLSALARAAVDLCGSGSEILHKPARAYDVGGFCGDPTLAGQVLGWRAQIGLEAGMSELRGAMIARARPIAPAIRPLPYPTGT